MASHACAISSEAAAAAAAVEHSSNGLKAGIVLFSSAQQLNQDKSLLHGAPESGHLLNPSSPNTPSELIIDPPSPAPHVVGDIISVNGQVSHQLPKCLDVIVITISILTGPSRPTSKPPSAPSASRSHLERGPILP